MHRKSLRVGIYAGTFDPVHTGHISFALQAIKTARLDQLVFLPERMPRNKQATEHYAHRIAMLKRAIKPHPDMSVLELVDKNFTVQRTWPQLRTIFPHADLVMIVGSDILSHLPDWPLAEVLTKDCELLVGARADDEPAMIRTLVQSWPHRPQQLHIVQSFAPHVSSTKIRDALSRHIHTHGLLASVHRYARSNWLYVSVEYAVRRRG